MLTVYGDVWVEDCLSGLFSMTLQNAEACLLQQSWTSSLSMLPPPLTSKWKHSELEVTVIDVAIDIQLVCRHMVLSGVVKCLWDWRETSIVNWLWVEEEERRKKEFQNIPNIESEMLLPGGRPTTVLGFRDENNSSPSSETNSIKAVPVFPYPLSSITKPQKISMENNTCINKLEGKVAIITGGASGIGEATAHLFAKHGARMVVLADIQDELGKNLSISIGSHRCTYIHCDVTDEVQVKSLVDSTVDMYGQLDIMFSNAGIISKSNQTIVDLDMNHFDDLFAVNVRGMAACLKHAAGSMVEKKVKGIIICTASVLGRFAAPQHTDYCMSKHAVIALMKSASKQLGQYGIRVNSVSPSVVATPLMCNLLGAEATEVEKFVEPFTSLKGVVLKAEDVAEAVLFLASGESGFITGHDLAVDGGFTY
ncbi:hypothetical protein L2E82_35900 [Cichorium intybus]|uniref:Uncharacterized protein n=1 Tax=Cichorium intybus TaxID=13427 RepID=A0ACB9BQD1_CICIN|nr:hypothetical protein L2E82_35900 [Cichorium intybus]